MRLLLLRHGQTPSNVQGLLDTRIPGPGLTPLGRQQADAVPRAFAGEEIAAIVVSTMRRTHETAAPLASARALAPVERAGIREITAGALEMRSDPESVRTYMGTVFRWAGGELDLAMPGGETGAAFAERYDGVVAEVEAAHPEGTVVLVSHGAAIRCWAGLRSSNLDAAYIAEHLLDNTGVVVLEGGAGRWRCVSWAGEPVTGLDTADPGPTGDGAASLGAGSSTGPARSR